MINLTLSKYGARLPTSFGKLIQDILVIFKGLSIGKNCLISLKVRLFSLKLVCGDGVNVLHLTIAETC